MATPIPPTHAIDEVILFRINLLYNPEWDGAAWVLDPNTITLDCIGNTGSVGALVTGSNIQLTAADLPPAGQAALQDLYGYVEQLMADQYIP